MASPPHVKYFSRANVPLMSLKNSAVFANISRRLATQAEGEERDCLEKHAVQLAVRICSVSSYLAFDKRSLNCCRRASEYQHNQDKKHRG